MRRLLVSLVAVLVLAACSDGEGSAEPVTITTAELTTTTEPTTTTTESTIPRPPDGSRERPYPFGHQAEVGNYEATVVAFTPDATAEVMGSNQFNMPPAAGEVYAMVRLRVTYQGDEEGSPQFDVVVGYIGSDGRVYTAARCGAVEPDSMNDQPKLVAGGTAEGNECIKIPAAVVGTGAVFLEDQFSFDGDSRVFWR